MQYANWRYFFVDNAMPKNNNQPYFTKELEDFWKILECLPNSSYALLIFVAWQMFTINRLEAIIWAKSKARIQSRRFWWGSFFLQMVFVSGCMTKNFPENPILFCLNINPQSLFTGAFGTDMRTANILLFQKQEPNGGWKKLTEIKIEIWKIFPDWRRKVGEFLSYLSVS